MTNLLLVLPQTLFSTEAQEEISGAAAVIPSSVTAVGRALARILGIELPGVLAVQAGPVSAGGAGDEIPAGERALFTRIAAAILKFFGISMLPYEAGIDGGYGERERGPSTGIMELVTVAAGINFRK